MNCSCNSDYIWSVSNSLWMAVTPLSYSKSILFFQLWRCCPGFSRWKDCVREYTWCKAGSCFPQEIARGTFWLWPSHFIMWQQNFWVQFMRSVLFFKKKTNKFSTLWIIHHWACLISVSILSIGISVLLLLRTAWFFIFHYQLVWTPGSRTLSLSYGKTDNSIAPVLADPEASF